jgi:hypothetical protein
MCGRRGCGPRSGNWIALWWWWRVRNLLRGQKRGIAVALRKAKEELRKLERRAASGRIQREALESRVQKALQREHLSEFVVATVQEHGGRVSLDWHVDAARRRLLEHTRLGRRVLCTDRHIWSTGRIVHAFRGQWNVEELFRRAKKGGVVPWGPSHQWADGSLRLHTFATVIGLTLVSLARVALGSGKSARGHDADAGWDRSYNGTGLHQTAWAAGDGVAHARTHSRTAQSGPNLRSRSLDSCPSFI